MPYCHTALGIISILSFHLCQCGLSFALFINCYATNEPAIHRNGSVYQQKRLQTVMKCKHNALTVYQISENKIRSHGRVSTEHFHGGKGSRDFMSICPGSYYCYKGISCLHHQGISDTQKDHNMGKSLY